MSERFRDQLQEAIAPAFTIEREIPGGGMSRVFVAIEHSLGRTVVVKVLRPDLAAGMNRDRFRREIMLAAQLQHPHIVPVLSAGERDDLIWYTMPFVEGESLREALARRGKFSPREVVRVMHDVLDALAYAHQRGVIHRDIKPGNILTHGSHALVTDFGVAKALSAAMPHSGATSAGIAIGTPKYMAPEQLAADPNADHRIDLYAVGLLAYELLTSEHPFHEESPAATMAAQLTRMPDPIDRVRPDVSAPLAAVVMHLLAKQPEDRPPTAAAALEELEEIMTPQSGTLSSTTAHIPPASASPASPTREAASRRRVSPLVLLGATALVVVAGAAIVLARRDRDPSVTTVQAPPPRAPAESASKVVSAPPADTQRTVRAPNETTRAATTPKQTVKGVDSARARQSVAMQTAPRASPRPAPAAVRPLTALTSATGKPRRLAVLPLTNATNRTPYGSIALAIEDSLKRAAAAAGYSLAPDAELVRLLGETDQNARRRTAEASSIGAVVFGFLTLSNRELQAHVIVLDVWRNAPQTLRSGSELDDSTGTLVVVRDVMRTLGRVSWRQRTDPRRAIVFDFLNQTGIDSLGVTSRIFADSVRATIRRSGVEIVGDSAARATTEANDRRFIGLQLGTGALVTGSVFRRRADSLRVVVAVRDMSEERNLDAIEVIVPLSDPMSALPNVLQRLAADIGRVNWGPKAGR